MKILITGSSGLIGSALIPVLTAQHHQVIRLVRRKADSEEGVAQWDPEAGRLDPRTFEGIEAVVNLAGENIGAARWTPERKTRIRESRVRGTKLLSDAIGQLPHPPKVLVSASAIGYYGSRGDETLSEDKPPGTGFLPEVCVAWEAATEPARQKGVRVVNLRFGMVLSGKGGALAPMVSAFKMGVGGKLGDGRQYMSWIAIDDLTSAIVRVITDDTFDGPVNTASPNPVRNKEFSQTLGRVLGRPTIFSMPAFAVRLVFGEMADALLLASTRVEPARLLAGEFTFEYPELESALRHILGKMYN
ncbi:MAG: TIGR01777 family oxidoreductase [Acidobacteria bacterium]|nr:TIGR01777 family oxidoreductase [Acidobacteriota bacterium]